MFGSPYSTTIGSKFNTAKVELALQQADIQKRLRVLDPATPWLVAVIDDPEIPIFLHPIILDDANRGRKVVVDLRQYKRNVNVVENPGGTVIKIAPYGGAAITVNRAVLQYMWGVDTADALLGLSNLPVSVYSRWVSEQIIRGLAVEETFHQQIRVVMAYFYIGLFSQSALDRNMMQKLASKVSQCTGIAISLVLEWVPDEMPQDVPGLVKLFSTGNYGMRLEHLSIGSFYTITTKGFFGVTRPDEVLAVAIEYPPTFLAIVHAIVNDRSYNKTPLQMAAKPYDRQNAFKLFNHAFESLVGHDED